MARRFVPLFPALVGAILSPRLPHQFQVMAHGGPDRAAELVEPRAGHVGIVAGRHLVSTPLSVAGEGLGFVRISVWCNEAVVIENVAPHLRSRDRQTH